MRNQGPMHMTLHLQGHTCPEHSKQFLGQAWPCGQLRPVFLASFNATFQHWGFFPAPKLAKPAIWQLKGTSILTS